jgi:hydantoinase/carbamoylase family amidase
MVPKINGERLWSDLMELGEIGFTQGRGVTRTALSSSDLACKQWFIDKCREAGLEVHVDAAYNVIARLRTNSPIKGCVVIGSHLDTVPEGGKFDGALGIVAGLECIRTIKENQIVPPWDIEVINFCDEEAAHNAGTVGSRAMMGQLREGEINQSINSNCSTFAEDLLKTGKNPTRIGEAYRNPNDFIFYLELHIEQGARLCTHNIQIGIVTAVVGIFRYLVIVEGKAAHAGTTPMQLREDALVKAAPVFTLLPEWIRARSPEMVGTIGKVEIHPAATNVIPGLCRFVVELRSQKTEDMVCVREALKEFAANKAGWKIETIFEKAATQLSEVLIQSGVNAANSEGFSFLKMPSGAGHDSQSFAAAGVPTGMIFIPCNQGISHSPEELIEKDHAIKGCQVLFRIIIDQAAQQKG